jgi:hypothetical protein
LLVETPARHCHRGNCLNGPSRIGRVQLGISRAFTVRPDREWTTRELMQWTHTLKLYQGKRSHRERHNHCRAIRRAPERYAERIGRRWPEGVIWRAKVANTVANEGIS